MIFDVAVEVYSREHFLKNQMLKKYEEKPNPAKVGMETRGNLISSRVKSVQFRVGMLFH